MVIATTNVHQDRFTWSLNPSTYLWEVLIMKKCVLVFSVKLVGLEKAHNGWCWNHQSGLSHEIVQVIRLELISTFIRRQLIVIATNKLHKEGVTWLNLPNLSTYVWEVLIIKKCVVFFQWNLLCSRAVYPTGPSRNIVFLLLPTHKDEGEGGRPLPISASNRPFHFLSCLSPWLFLSLYLSWMLSVWSFNFSVESPSRFIST